MWWFGFFVALLVCFYLIVAKRDDVAALLIVLFAPLILPWLVYSRPIFMSCLSQCQLRLYRDSTLICLQPVARPA